MEWISVKDKLPEPDTQVLVSTNFEEMYTCRLHVILRKNNQEYSRDDVVNERVTHWMPMPKPPKA